MANKLRRIFFPTPEEEKEDRERIDKFIKEFNEEHIKDRSCITCKNKIHVVSYPGFVTGEEWECTAGLECDTVLDSIRNCPKWCELLIE